MPTVQYKKGSEEAASRLIFGENRMNEESAHRRRGFAKLARRAFDNWLWQEKPFDRWHAWEYMWAERARFSNGQSFFMKKLFDLRRGQFVTTYRQLGRDWGWSVDKVKRYLKTLHKANMVRTQTEQGCLVVTICNYDVYQVSEYDTEHKPDANRTQTKQRPNRDQTGTRQGPNRNPTRKNKGNKGKNGEKGNKAEPAPPPVETLWKLLRKCGITGSQGQLRDLAGKLAQTYSPEAVAHTMSTNPHLRGIDVFVLERKMGNGLVLSGQKGCPDCGGSGKEKGSSYIPSAGRHPYCHCVRIPQT